MFSAGVVLDFETTENAWAIKDVRSCGENVEVILSTSEAERMRREEDGIASVGVSK